MLKKISVLLAFFALISMAWAEPEADFLEPEQALKMSASARDAQTIEVRFNIAQGYYLYKNKLKLSADQNVTLGEIDFPPSIAHDDPNFGKVETYRGQLILPVRVQNPAAQQFKLTVIAQGCADAGLCYPPISQEAFIHLPAVAKKIALASSVSSLPVPAFVPASVPAIAPVLPVATLKTTAPQADISAPQADNESSKISALLGSGNVLLILLSFFGFGLLLAFTPCVFPMMPILSGIIVGHGDKITKRRALLLSLSYVLGMAVSYAIAGVAAGLSGTLLVAALQNIWVLGGFALIFVLLALSMFGFYELQLPAALQSKLSGSANKQQAGSMWGMWLMGALSALIVGPCVAAPLAGALLYIAQTQNAFLGGAALFVMALGMGVPLIMVACAASALPRAGAWMENIKKVFGVLLLAVAIWLVSPVLPAVFAMLAWAALLIISAIFLRALDPLPLDSSGWLRFSKGLGVIALLVGSAILFGALSGGRDPLQPLQVAQTKMNAEPYPPFSKVSTLAELERELAQTNQPVMLDFYADWCVSCKEMEKLTFSNPEVAARMGQMKRLQVDVTANTDDDKALLKRFKLFGPPGIIFFNKEGKELQSSIGFKSAEPFKQLLDQVLAK